MLSLASLDGEGFRNSVPIGVGRRLMLLAWKGEALGKDLKKRVRLGEQLKHTKCLLISLSLMPHNP